MPCKDCPDEANKKAEQRPCNRIPDPDLCRIWEILAEVNQARVHFQKHLELASCKRCKEVAVEILAILDIYSRMLNNAENYKLERLTLGKKLQALAKSFDSEVPTSEETGNT